MNVTRTATGLTFSEVDSVVQASAAGDIVTLPTGTATWAATEQLIIRQPIRIQGGGMSGPAATTINSSYDGTGAGGKGCINWSIALDPAAFTGPFCGTTPPTWGLNDLVINNSTGATQMFWMQGGTSQNGVGGNPVAGLWTGISRNLRFHHLALNGFNQNLFKIQDIIGLIDHCIMTNTGSGAVADIFHEHWPNSNGSAGTGANGSYQSPVNYGSEEFLIFEDCDITTAGKGMTDAWDGARFVVRYCRLRNTGAVTDHGTETQGGHRGTRAVEEYNVFETRTGNPAPAEHRSGTWIGFNNLCSNNNSYKRLRNHRNTLIKDLGGVFGTSSCFLGKQLNYAGPRPSIDQNTPLAADNVDANGSITTSPTLPSTGNEPVLSNNSPVIGTWKCSAGSIEPDVGGTITVTNVDGSAPTVDGVNGHAAWQASTGGPLGLGTWKTLNTIAATFTYINSTGFNFVVTNISLHPGDGSAPQTNPIGYTSANAVTSGPATVGDNLGNSNGVNTLVINANQGNNSAIPFCIAVGQSFTIRKVYGPLDMPGRGVSDVVPANQVVPSQWPHQVRDACYEWNNYKWASETTGGTTGSPLSWRPDDGSFVGGFSTAATRPCDFYVNTVKPGYPQIADPSTAQRTIGTLFTSGGASTTLLPTNAVYGSYPHSLTGGGAMPTISVPRGVFSLNGSGDRAAAGVLANPYVDGISVRYQWYALQPTSAAGYFFNDLDTIIQDCATAGKKVCLRIGTGGGDVQDNAAGHSPGNKPHWLIQEIQASSDPADIFYDFIDGSNGTAHIPVFWSPTKLSRHRAMIQALAVRYSNSPLLSDGTPVVKVFEVNGANANSEDWAIPDSNSVDGLPPSGSTERSRWTAAGFTAQKIIDLHCATGNANGLIDVSMAAWTNQAVGLAINAGGKNIDTSNPAYSSSEDQWMPLAIIQNARAKFGARFEAQRNNLNALHSQTFPNSSDAFNILFLNPPCAFQSVWNVANDTTNYRMNGGTPDNIHNIFRKCTNTAIASGARFWEVYESDVLFNWQGTSDPNPVLGYGASTDEIKYAHDQLTSVGRPNLPPSVSMTTDAGNYTAPATVTLMAVASDSDGTVTKVEFYHGGTNLIATVTSVPYTYLWTGVAAGSYTLTAKTTDNVLATTTSSPVNITVAAAVVTGLAAPTIVVSA